MGQMPEVIGVVVVLIALYGILRLRDRISRDFIRYMKLRIEARYDDPQSTKRTPLANIAAILIIALILAAGLSAFIPAGVRLIVFAILLIAIAVVIFMLVYL